MKILYAASNNHSARVQLSRFLKAMQNTEHQIKVAAYKRSSPKGTNIDWTLDALLNVYKPELLSLDNDNLGIYFEQVKSFAPDLIISDLEYFTSYLAGLMDTTLWQCSSSLVNYALTRDEKYNLGLFKYYAHSLNRDPLHTAQMLNLIDNSKQNLVYSHYGDTSKPPAIQDNFHWVRPYHQVYKPYPPCRHVVVAGLSENNKQVLDILRQYPDTVVFLESEVEQYNDLYVKDIGIEDEYYCNLRNCNHFVCQGQSCFLADAYYNEQYSIIYPDYDDTDCLINSQLSKKLSIGDVPYHGVDIAAYSTFEMLPPTYNPAIKYLHEWIQNI